MSGSIPLQIRGTPGNGPPVGLVERQLAVEMNNGNLWVGVPVSIDSTGRIQLNPRRVPAGGTQWQVLVRDTGAAFSWQDLGSRDNDNTVVGRGALASNQGDFNTAVGQYALYGINTTSNGNTAFGNNAAGAVASTTNSLYLGANTQPLGAAQTNQIVIGANTTGHGSNTATIGADSGPNAMTQLWVGGRDLLRVGEFGTFAQVTLAGLPNDNSVNDICSTTVGAGYWLVNVRVAVATGTATPWIHYEFGLNYATGQTAITDAALFSTAAGSVYEAQLSHVCFIQVTAPTLLVASVRAQNATNAGTYAVTMSVMPVRLA